MVGIKLTPTQAEALRRAANEDDRPLSHFLRRQLLKLIPPHQPQTPEGDSK